MTRGKAKTWNALLFLASVPLNLSFLYTQTKIYHFPAYKHWLGHLFFAVLFACGWGMGKNADPDHLKGSASDQLMALIQPAPYLALVFVIGLLLVQFLLGWSWTWRALPPLVCGIIAGALWARQQPAEEPKRAGKEPPPVDVWKP